MGMASASSVLIPSTAGALGGGFLELFFDLWLNLEGLRETGVGDAGNQGTFSKKSAPTAHGDANVRLIRRCLNIVPGRHPCGFVTAIGGTRSSQKRLQVRFESPGVLEADDFFAQYSLAVVQHSGWQAFDSAEFLFYHVRGDR